MRERCAICADGLLDDEESNPVALVPCGHTFHSKCVKSWMRKYPSECAECRLGVQKLVQLQLNRGHRLSPVRPNVNSVGVEANLMQYEKWCHMENEVVTLKEYRLGLEIKLEKLQSMIMLRENKIRLLQVRNSKYIAEITKLGREIDEHKSGSAFQKRKEQKLQKANSKLLQANKENSDKVTELKKVNALFNDELNALRVAANQFQFTSTTVQNEKEYLKQELEKNSKLSDAQRCENETLQKANADLQKINEQQVSKIEELKRINVILGNEMERRQLELKRKIQVEQDVSNLQRVASDCIRRLNNCIHPNSKWKKMTTGVTQEIGDVEIQMDDSECCESLENSISKWETEISKLHLESSSRTRELTFLRRSNVTFKVEIADLKNVNALLRDNISRLKINESSLAEMRQNLWTCQNKNENLQERIKSLLHLRDSVPNLEQTIRQLRENNLELSRQTEHVSYLENSVRQLMQQNYLLKNPVMAAVSYLPLQ